MNHQLEKADVIIVMGSHDIQVADRGAELLLNRFAPVIVMSGGLGKLTSKMWDKPEAVLFAQRAIELGVPESQIIIENKSQNTGQNVEFSKKLLNEIGIKVAKAIVVQKPYMERRAYATFKKVWPEVDIIVTSPQIPFEEYKSQEVSREDMINIMVGDLQRVKEYPKMGYQISQSIPDDVWNAYEKLVAQGYTKHLI